MARDSCWWVGFPSSNFLANLDEQKKERKKKGERKNNMTSRLSRGACKNTTLRLQSIPGRGTDLSAITLRPSQECEQSPFLPLTGRLLLTLHPVTPVLLHVRMHKIHNHQVDDEPDRRQPADRKQQTEKVSVALLFLVRAMDQVSLAGNRMK